MCGIVGLFLKRDDAGHELGRLLAGMLGEMADRGPDSTGFAVYGDSAPAGTVKATLYAVDPAHDWTAFGRVLAGRFEIVGAPRHHGSHAVFTVRADEIALRDWLAADQPAVRAFGFGSPIEVYKDVGLPAEAPHRYRLE